MSKKNKAFEKVYGDLESKPAQAAAAIVPEDLELERSLQTMTAALPELDDVEPIGSVVKIERPRLEMLSEVASDYRPANSRQEILDQVHLAKVEGCDSIEATLPAIRQICRDSSLESVGYFLYHDVKVFIEGRASDVKIRDGGSIESKIFRNSKEDDRKAHVRAKIKALEAELE